MATKIAGIAGLKERAGEHLGYSPWHVVTQEQVDRFAEATGDHQWIHVDVERAKAGPFGGTIAHGYLTLSLLPYLLPQIIEVEDISMGINYGLNRLRFPSPVPVGSRVRVGVELAGIEDVAGGVQATLKSTFEAEVPDAGSAHGSDKPVCVAEVLFRYYA